jgi:flagellar biosynthesis protein FlhG
MTAESRQTGNETRAAATIAVTSGKGGVGKTSVVVNLAVALARLRNRVGILDADFGLGNVDVLLGLAPENHLGHLLTGEKDIEEIIVRGPLGVQIIPASSGLRELTALTEAQWLRLAQGLERVCRQLDFLLIDTAAGVSDNVVELLLSAQRVLIVTSLEPSAMVDAYAMAKVLTTAEPGKEIGVLVNGARDGDEAELVFRQLDLATSRFLQRGLRYYGFVPFDPAVREAVLVQRPIVDHRPQSPASRCFRVLASKIAALSPVGGPGLRLVPPGTRPPANRTGAEVQRCA